ncbi:type III secretion protein [Pseudomonas syringae]|uniref:type III secretion protein n=1 Tax=Pseudomonas syringae TaxID=317 RepID=UPI000CDA5F59|nr:type III secretion protein [Pseudomonas syringae]POP74769.1 type III secretion protein [Pseudomonas syringae pv. syringae]
MNAAQSEQWQALVERPLTFVRERWLAECLQRGVDPATLASLRDSSRFATRFEQLLNAHFKLHPLPRLEQPAQDDLAVLLLTDKDFARLPRLCGAVWHAATLSREIRGDVVSEYRQALGDDAFSLALAQRHLAGAANLLRTPVELVQAIDRDGACCVAAWLEAQPIELQAWLRLRLDIAQNQPQQGDERQVTVVQTVARLLTGSDDHE